MAVILRKTSAGSVFQVRIQDSDGKWIGGGVFDNKRDAVEANQKLKRVKRRFTFSSFSRKITISDYFAVWFDATESMGASPGWRSSQFQMFRDYVEPLIGKCKLHEVTASHGLAVIQRMKKELGRGDATCVHVYILMHKIFQDAIEYHELLERNPINKKIKPSLVHKEADFLTMDEVRKLITYVDGKPYELAVWLQLLIGPRVGEVQGLLWKNVDLKNGIIHIRRTFVRNDSKAGELVFKEYPKGKRWHDIPIPMELLAKLKEAKAAAVTEFVANPPQGGFLEYSRYLKALKKYCQEAKIKSIATHGLRHSTAELWMQHGAGRDDIRAMFAHSSSEVTDRYIHRQSAKQLERFSNTVRLFPESSPKSSQTGDQEAVMGEIETEIKVASD